MIGHSPLILALAGTAIFMFGINIASENLQKLAANRVRDLIAQLSDKPYWGVALGVLLTVLIQSSGAVTSMLVGLGSAGVITLKQVMSVILGTTIGTTITVQLLSLNVGQYGLPLFTFAFLVQFLTTKRVLKLTMSVVMGFGLIFWGLELIGYGTQVLKEARLFIDMLQILKGNPWVAILITAAITAVVHSSAVTIGFAMTLASAGLISLTDAIYWVYGANIGTTATALIASAGGNYVGRQVAWAHMIYKVAGVLLFVFLTEPFAELLYTGMIQRDVANSHTVYNLLAALIFYPFIQSGAKAIEKLFPPSVSERAFSVKYLDRATYQSASVALAHAEREVLRMADIVQSMVVDSVNLFRNENHEQEESIKTRDNKVDLLNREIHLFLAEIMDQSQGQRLEKPMMRLMSFATDLENIGDVVDNGLLDLARKKHTLKLQFTEPAWKEIQSFHAEVVEVMSLSVSCFQTQDPDLASKVIAAKREIRKIEKGIRESHILRLVENRDDSIKTSSVFIDCLGEYRRIVGLVSNHAYGVARTVPTFPVPTEG